jgi:hypothetical protein
MTLDANLNIALDVIIYNLMECQKQSTLRLFDYGRPDVIKLRKLLDDAEDLAMKIQRMNGGSEGEKT